MDSRVQKSFPRTASCLPEIFAFMDAFFDRAGVGDSCRNTAQLAVVGDQAVEFASASDGVAQSTGELFERCPAQRGGDAAE
jgi:uncharacterized membrane protein